MTPSRPQPTAPKRPGPAPIFTERLVVNLRSDQRRSLDYIAGVCEVTVSEASGRSPSPAPRRRLAREVADQ